VDLMEQCWLEDLAHRPTAAAVLARFIDITQIQSVDSPIIIIIIIILPRYSVPREKKNYAMQRKMSSWNGPYSSSSFPKLSWSRIALKR